MKTKYGALRTLKIGYTSEKGVKKDDITTGVTITEIGISNENPSMIREPTSAKIMETVIIPRR